MFRSFILNNYLGKEFLKTVLNISMVFLFLGFTLNFFEEINFFKDYDDVGINLPIILSILFVLSKNEDMSSPIVEDIISSSEQQHIFASDYVEWANMYYIQVTALFLYLA